MIVSAIIIARADSAFRWIAIRPLFSRADALVKSWLARARFVIWGLIAALVCGFAQGAVRSVSVGQTVTFSVTADGTKPFTYLWKKNGVPLGEAVEGSYRIGSVTTADAGVYSVVVSNGAGSTSSDLAILTVEGALVGFSISAQPTAQSVIVGQSVSFSVTATGSGPLSYQWKKNGWDLRAPNAPTLTLGSVAMADAGAYSVTVANAVGIVSSIEVALTVSAAPVAPVITAQPAAKSVAAGESASFSVGATGSAVLVYQWKKNGENLTGAHSPVLTLPSTGFSDTGYYSAVVSNGVGSATSVSASLTVNAAPVAPSITSQPAAQSVTAGAAVSFSVKAAGSGTLDYQWKKNSVVITGAVSPTLTIASTSADDAGGYSVVVNNSVASVTSSIVSLTVSTAPVTPSITLQPAQKSAVAGDSVSFSVEATGSAPLYYQWQKDGASLTGANSAILTLPNTSLADAGSYSAVVSNSVGSINSSAALLTVTAAPPAPGDVGKIPAPPSPAPGPGANPGAGALFISQYTAIDIGSGPVSGTTRYSSAAQTLSLTAAGGEIAGVADSFHFASAGASGNFTIVTKLNSFASARGDAVAGIMIRERSAGDSASASIVITSSGTVKLIRRMATSTSANTRAGRAVLLPVYLRLSRTNGVVTGDYSSNGVDWATLGSAEMPMADAVRAGLVLASKSTSTTTTAEMNVPALTLATQPTLVGGLQLIDVGVSGATAAAYSSKGVISLSGLGQMLPAATRESAAFLARHNMVECAVTANVLPSRPGIPPARAGLMIRESLLDNAPQASLAINAHGQVVFEFRASTAEFASTRTLNETARHLLLDRQNNVVTAMVSNDGITWRTVASAKVIFQRDPWIGVTTTSSWWTSAITADFNSFDVINH